MVSDVESFLSAVKKLGLVAAEELQIRSAEIQQAGLTSQEEVANEFIENKLLTVFQAERLLAGEGDDCVLAQRYHILEKIGAGGMGNVYRARDIKLGRIVAIKLMASHNLSDPDAVLRFEREARALAALALPNVVQAFDSGEDHDRNFLVMEFVQGIGLAELIKQKGQIPPTVAADYVYQVAVAMQRAHDRAMIHRDIKPGNLILNEEGQIKILDLGLAKFIQDQIPESQLTQDNTGLGTPDYMPPEQFRDARNVDRRADIYALGCTLYHLIAGQVPFPGTSFSQKVHAHETKQPTPLEELCPANPAGLGVTVERMMAKRPADRFQSMHEVATNLALYVAGSSPSLPSVKQTISYLGGRSNHHRRRSRLFRWLGGAAAVLALIVVAASTLPGIMNSKDAQDERRIRLTNRGQSVGKGIAGDEGSGISDGSEQVRIADGFTVAKDGTGNYHTINEALANIESGKRILVLDDATYSEQIVIDDPQKHRGITLEAQQKATIQLTDSMPSAVLVKDVANVRITGFRFREEVSRAGLISFVQVRDHAPGVHIADLSLSNPAQTIYGIVVLNTNIGDFESPIVIRNCRIDGCKFGIALNGLPSAPMTHARIQENWIGSSRTAIGLQGTLGHVLLSGNVIQRSASAAIQMDNLDFAGPVLIANNSCFDNRKSGVVITLSPPHEPPAKGHVELCNNIILDSHLADMLYSKAERQGTELTPGGGQFLLDVWSFHHNYRDRRCGFGDQILPLSEHDVDLNLSDIVSRTSDSPDFLKPKSESPLAQQGAGSQDASLPAYVGAVPPAGVGQWDWDQTWNSQARWDGRKDDR